jgi:hypothetical protein
MRALLLLAATTGCAAILGDYEVDPALDKKDALVDSATDTAVIDTGVVTDTATDVAPSNIKPCKDLGAGKEGPQPLGDGVTSFCSDGYTLVALRSSTTNGDVWAGVPAALRTKDLNNANVEVDRVLDIDWKLLKFTELVYDLGTKPVVGTKPTSPTRVYFRGLNEAQQGAARDALGVFVPNPMRLDCLLDMSMTPITKCEEPPMPPTLSPTESFGWAFLSKKAICYWAYKGKPGAPNCNDGMVGAGRVWVK